MPPLHLGTSHSYIKTIGVERAKSENNELILINLNETCEKYVCKSYDSIHYITLLVCHSSNERESSLSKCVTIKSNIT